MASSSESSTAPQLYDGTIYADQVQQAILHNFALSSLADACPHPSWVCAIGSITSPQPGWINVTLQPDWERVMGEWTGPPAGIGCFKWGQQIARNITNFTQAAHVPPPDSVSVYKPDGIFC